MNEHQALLEPPAPPAADRCVGVAFGLPGGIAQPIVGLLYMLAAVVIAQRLPRVSGRTPAPVAVA